MGEYLHYQYEKAEGMVKAEKQKAFSFFSFSEYGNSHYLLYFFGIKIKFLKRAYAEKKSKNFFYYYKKNKIDITTIPSAEGNLRELQLANLVLLEELDYVCKQSGLRYWLDGGTLLGAVRHKGFIPWDDDIDTAMLREDYEKIVEAFNKYSRNPDIYVDYYRSLKNPCNCYLRVLHRKCKYLFVDIFPWDNFGKRLNHKEQLKESARIRKLRKELEKICTKDKENLFVINKVSESMYKKVLVNPGENEGCDYVWGMDFGHCWKNWFTAYEVVHPLGEIEFEGKKYPCINNPHAFLERIYGNYMDYPKKLTCGHSMYTNYSEEDLKTIQEIIGDRNG